MDWSVEQENSEDYRDESRNNGAGFYTFLKKRR